ncbi:type II toxin-antitoxin system Phd/YefM family antitoxin [Nonomuraea sp. NPDC059194]|uniref:type II toxin-antitoxin system Phd/YefM family antitoxin n=1 Tax=Nonomuraea sp. NPDC059194 TaxID=3346764 RepID=UPI003674F67B
MDSIPARDLRNKTAEILRRVEAGEEIEVLQNNRPVARLVPVRPRRRWIPAGEVVGKLRALPVVDAGLAAELRESLPDTTDDLPW